MSAQFPFRSTYAGCARACHPDCPDRPSWPLGRLCEETNAPAEKNGHFTMLSLGRSPRSTRSLRRKRHIYRYGVFVLFALDLFRDGYRPLLFCFSCEKRCCASICSERPRNLTCSSLPANYCRNAQPEVHLVEDQAAGPS